VEIKNGLIWSTTILERDITWGMDNKGFCCTLILELKMNGTYVNNLGEYLFFGTVEWDELGNMLPQPNGWKIRLVDNVDGTRRMVFIYVNQDGDDIEMYSFNPPSSLSTSQFKR
jgi:hypothetical protein